MIQRELHLVVPGALDQRTGGYVYDARVARGLRRRGWHLHVHELAGRFPRGDEEASSSLEGHLAAIADGSVVVVDGLAMGGLPGPVHQHAPRLRLVSLVHHPLADETGIGAEASRHFARTEPEALGYGRGVIATSAFTARRLEELGVRRARIRVVPPGVDPAPPASGPGPGEPPRLLCVATVTPRKGHDVLVRALARLGDQPWSCVCVGSLDRAPEHARDVLALTESRSLADRVRFVGECDDDALATHYRESSVFVLASHYEGYGMVFTEALARGLPVVATTGGAIPETVPPGAGALAPPGDANALARALEPLLSTAPASSPGHDSAGAMARSAMREEALRHAATLPGWESTVETFERALLELAAPARERAPAG